MTYVDGFLLAVPKANLEAYKAMARAAGAVWKDFLEEALKDKDFLELWRNLNKCLKEYGKDGGTTNR